MRHVILLDTKITERAYSAWMKEDIAFWEEHLGITPEYIKIRTDYTHYPTYVDSDGDVRPTDKYLQSLTDMVVAKHGDFDCDFIMVMVHEDNWRSDTTPDIKGDGIWGTNYSYVFGKQCLDYCRWDKDNKANTFGTAYHERMHSMDAIINQEIGRDAAKILGLDSYDRYVVHGKGDDWEYIRYKENTKALKVLKPYLLEAFQKRKERHNEVLNLYGQVITLASKLLYLLKMRKNKKDGVGVI